MDNEKHLEVNDIIIQLQQVDWMRILPILSPIISYYVTKKVANSYIFHKEYKPKNVKSIVLPPELIPKYSDIDEEKILAQEFGEVVLEFAKFMVLKFPSVNLVNFYNNINELMVSQKSDFKSKGTNGTYNIKKNKIDVKDKSPVYHELFHMASSIFKKDCLYSGFSQAILKPKIINLGDGINEGYTQLLTNRYFKNVASDKIYPYLVLVAGNLELVLGQEKMEKLYLNADLLGLINELKKYISESEIMQFIAAMDFVKYCNNSEKTIFDKKDMLVKSLKTISNFLIRIYAEKLICQIEEEKITRQEAVDELAKYTSSLGCAITIGKHRYEYLTVKGLEEIFSGVLPRFQVASESIETSTKQGK